MIIPTMAMVQFITEVEPFECTLSRCRNDRRHDQASPPIESLQEFPNAKYPSLPPRWVLQIKKRIILISKSVLFQEKDGKITLSINSLHKLEDALVEQMLILSDAA